MKTITKRVKVFRWKWKVYHFFVIFFIAILASSKAIPFYYFVLCCFALRLVLMIRMIHILGTTDKNIHLPVSADNRKGDKVRASHFVMLFRILKVCCLVLLAIFFTFYLKLKNTYTGDLHLVDANGEIVTDQKATDFKRINDNDEEHYQYEVKNMLPEWTQESDSKYGLLNVVTGENTGPIYDEYLEFDNDNTAWDGKGHMINASGKEIVTLPGSILKRKSEHQIRIDKCLSYFYTESESNEYLDDQSSKKSYCPMVCEYTFFHDGIGVYYDELSCKYGFINDSGNLLSKPIYDDIYIERQYEKLKHNIFIAHFNDHGTPCIYYINKDFKVILEDTNEHKISVLKIDYEQGFIEYLESSDDYKAIKYKIIDEEESSNEEDRSNDFKIIDTDFGIGTNDVRNARSLDENDKKAYALSDDWEIVFSSEQYTDYYSRIKYDSDTIDYLIAKNQSGNYEMINLDGEQIIPGEFSDVLSGDGVLYLCRSTDDPDYAYQVFIIDDGEYVAELSVRDLKTWKYFGYGIYYNEEQERYDNYYWRLNTDDKCEIYALDGTLLDTVFNTTSFEFYHKKPDTASENYYSDIPEAVTIKYIYVDYVGHNLYAVSNERPAYIGY